MRYLLDELLFGTVLCTLVRRRREILFSEFKVVRENKASPRYVMICYIYSKKWHRVKHLNLYKWYILNSFLYPEKYIIGLPDSILFLSMF